MYNYTTPKVIHTYNCSPAFKHCNINTVSYSVIQCHTVSYSVILHTLCCCIMHALAVVQVKDWKLFLGVFALVVIDVVILTVYMIVEGSNIYPDGMTGLHARRVINREFPEQTEGVGGVGGWCVRVCEGV